MCYDKRRMCVERNREGPFKNVLTRIAMRLASPFLLFCEAIKNRVGITSGWQRELPLAADDLG
jgi:hypothetical protein